jgi:hypothetical protein
MKSEDLFKIHKKLCNDALSLMKKKNHDYAGNSGVEPFANFTRAEAMGITSTEKAMLVRMLDKMSRLSSFVENKEFKVEDEKLQDTIVDMINYSVLLYAYLLDKKQIDDIPYDLIQLHNYKEYVDCDPYDPYSKGGSVPNSVDSV